MYGYSIEELTGRPILDVYAPVDRPRLAGWLQAAHKKGHITYEAQHIRKDGSIFPVQVDITAVKDENGSVLYRVVNVQDISERKRVEAELARRDAIMQAVVFAAEIFLQKSTDWAASIQVLLEKLGQAAGVSRVYIFEKHTSGDGVLLVSQRYEWTAPGITSQAGNPDLLDVPFSNGPFERWKDLLLQGQFVYGLVRDFPVSERPILEDQNILSIMVVPIFVGETWWGFMGFDDCVAERQWSAPELGSLKTAASTLGAAIQRQITEAALRQSEQRYAAIISAIEEGLIVQDAGGVIRTFNTSAGHILGLTAAEIVGRRMQDMNWQAIHEDGSPFPDQDYPSTRTLRTGKPCNNVVIGLRLQDGRRVWVNINSRPLFKQGEERPYAVIATFSDISDRRQAYQLLEQRVAERTRQLSALLEVSHRMASTLEPEPLLSIILQQLQTVVDYTGASIVTLEGDEYVVQDYIGPLEREKILRFRLSTRADTGYARVTQSRKPVIIADIWKDDPWLKDLRDLAGPEMLSMYEEIHAWMGVPLIAHDRLIGLLRMDHYQPGHFTESDATLVMAFANQAAVAIENAHLYEQAQALATLQERQRLARELHDSVSQALYGIALGVRTARMQLERDPARADEPLEYAMNLAEAGLAEMRALIFELRPESLEMEGLVAALQKTAAALLARHPIQVETSLCPEPELSLPVKEALYRITLEAAQNTIKHAHASCLHIRLCQEGQTCLLEVIDDGAGFDAGQAFPGHLGLRSMRERAEQVGCAFKIKSGPNGGTHILVRAPLSTAVRQAHAPSP
jgi:PAS domain S-box-containing protein